MVDELVKRGVPVITPAGGLRCHIDAARFVDHIPQQQYPAGALAAALYITGGIRGMERGTLSEQRNVDGSEPLAAMELVRLALPRRVFTLSQCCLPWTAWSGCSSTGGWSAGWSGPRSRRS
jgi:tryptophanase